MTWQEITDFTKKYIPCSISNSGYTVIDLPSELCYYSIIRCEFDGIRIAYNFKILNNSTGGELVVTDEDNNYCVSWNSYKFIPCCNEKEIKKQIKLLGKRIKELKNQIRLNQINNMFNNI